MRSITVIGASDVEFHNTLNKDEKNLVVKGNDLMSVSDGYHTFEELYDHRITLYIGLCKKINAEDEQAKSLRAFKEGFVFDAKGWIRRVWRSRLHADGSSFEGWYVLGIDKEPGKQITYHLPLTTWDETEFAETLERGPEFDGHTPKDVLWRLTQI